MSSIPPLVVPIFATPFGAVTLPEGAALNPALLALIEARHAAGTTDGGSPGSNPLCHHSRDDLPEWPEPAMRELTTAMLRGVCGVVGSVNEFSEDEFRSFRIEARGWFTIVEQDGCVPATLHPLASWCAMYCVAAPPPAVGRVDGGVLRLYESRFGTAFPDATNSVMRLPFRPGHYAWRPVPGQMAVFPASLTHEIALSRAPGRLVLVTLRIRFVAPGQQGVGRW